jgi:hypothetical protein
MTGSDADRLIDEYLGQLDAALDALPDARAVELVDEIDEHIAAARAELPGGGTEAELRTLLERLGSPAEIARDALDEEPSAPAGQLVVTRRGGWVEGLAVVLLPFGGLLIPFLGWFAGVALLWSSDHWTTRDKLIGTLVPPGGYMFMLFLVFVSSGDGETCSSVSNARGDVIRDSCSGPSIADDALAIGLIGVLLALPLATMIYLLRRRKALPVAITVAPATA